MTTKTLGQVLYRAYEYQFGTGDEWDSVTLNHQTRWEDCAQAVRAVVLDECATQIRTLTEELARTAETRNHAQAELNKELQQSMTLRTEYNSALKELARVVKERDEAREDLLAARNALNRSELARLESEQIRETPNLDPRVTALIEALKDVSGKWPHREEVSASFLINALRGAK